MLKEGDLGDGVGGWMSLGGMLKGIEIDWVVGYEGGIYKNFGVNVMREEFDGEMIMGRVVSWNGGKGEEGEMMGEVERMMMEKRD